jgi:hypothetical protein
MSMRARICLMVLWLASLVAVRVWAQTQQPDQKVISGSDFGFRVERVDRTGNPLGRLVVRVNGQWVEAGFAPGVTRATN